MRDVDIHLQNFAHLNGSAPASVQQLRRTALSRFAELGFPTTRLEDWKYTSVARLARTPFRLAAAPARVTADQLADGTLSGASQLVFVNGRHAPELSALRPLPPGVRLTSLAAAFCTDAALVETHLGRYADYTGAAFAALNTAFIQDGAFVFLPKGAIVTDVIHVLFVSVGSGEPTIAHPRNLIVAEEGSQATVVETYIGLGTGAYCTNAVTEIAVEPNATLVHCKLQQESDAAFHVATVQARQDADSRFASYVVSIGGGLVRGDINAVLDAPGGSCTLDGLYLAASRQHVDHHTSIDHRRPHCTSRELYKGILDGHATGVFNGKVFVRPAAQKSDAGQVNKNLLLSEDAVINTKPQLEILNDDVKCSHGATIGRLDEDALFYLRARGIGADEARRLLIYAFANEVVERVAIEPLRARLERMIASRFHDAGAAEVAK